MFENAPSKRTLIVSLFGLVGVATLIWVSFRPDPVPVDLSPVTRGPLQVTIDADAQTRVREIFEIAAPISGMARRSPLSVGDPVIGGETVVAAVEPVPPSLLDIRTRIQAEAAISETEAALNVAETDLRRAHEEQAHEQSNFDRARILVERGVASSTQLEDAVQALAIANAKVDSAVARIDMARGALDRAKAALIEPGGDRQDDGSCCIPLLAPVDGVVLEIDVISARPVTAGARLATVGDPRDLEIVADLLSNDAVRLTPGALAIVERWGGDAPLKARLRRIEPKARTNISALGIEEQRVDALFDFISEVPDYSGLGDNFSVFLRIVEWQADDALQVPLSATVREGVDWAVFVVEDSTAKLRIVSLGRRATKTTQVLGGLEEGEVVVTHPSDALEDGSTVIER